MAAVKHVRERRARALMVVVIVMNYSRAEFITLRDAPADDAATAEHELPPPAGGAFGDANLAATRAGSRRLGT